MADNCWEYWDCEGETREQCPAYYSDSGKECWMVAGSIVDKSKQCPRIAREFKDCCDCPWYVQLSGSVK